MPALEDHVEQRTSFAAADASALVSLNRLEKLAIVRRAACPYKHVNKEGTRMVEIASGILGYPRIGSRRELKWALERYWSGNFSEPDLLRQAAEIRRENWEAQRRSGASWV